MFVYENPFKEQIFAPELADPAHAERLVERIGLHVDNMNFMWDEIGYHQADPESLTKEEYRSNCLQRLYQLEQQRPGLVRLLNSDRGLYNFGRIPLRSLLLQNQPGRRFARRMWAGFAAIDGNGALMDTAFCLDRAHERMAGSEETDLAIDEFYRVDGLGEQLERRAYEWQRDDAGPPAADIVIFASHGATDRLLLYEWYGGRGGTLEEVYPKDIEQGIGKAILGISHPNTVVLVDACSTAQGNASLCEAIYEYTGLHTIGAVADVETGFLRFKNHGGRLGVVPGFFSVTGQGDRYVRHRSPARHFPAGASAW